MNLVVWSCGELTIGLNQSGLVPLGSGVSAASKITDASSRCAVCGFDGLLAIALEMASSLQN